MKNKKKLLGLFAVAALSVSALALCTMQPATASAEETESYFTIQDGASVRLANNDGISGIRFAAYVSETYYNTLKTTYSTADSITLESTVSKVVGEDETAPSPLTCSWVLTEDVFNDEGVATFYHTLKFNTLTEEERTAASAYVLEADFWIDVATADGTTKVEADNAATVDTTRAMRQVAYTAYTTPGTEETPNPAYQAPGLNGYYFTDKGTTEAPHDVADKSKAMKELAPADVTATTVYEIADTSVVDITDKTLADDTLGTGVFADADAKSGLMKTFVYFDAENNAYTTQTRFVTQIVDTEEELKAILTGTFANFYYLLTKDLTVTGLTNAAKRTLQNGTFDGNGHKITATTATTKTDNYYYRYGLFGFDATGLTVKNLEIDFTRTFTASNEDNTILANKGASTFENIDLQIHAANNTTITHTSYYLNIVATKNVATAKNVVVRVDSNVIASGKQLVGVGFKANDTSYVFYSGDWKFTSGVNFGTRYTDVAAAVDAGQKFANLTATGYWTLDEANKTLTFGKTN